MQAPVEDPFRAIKPRRRASSRLSDGEAPRDGSPWSAGHGTELRRTAETDRDRFKQRALEAEKEVKSLRATLRKSKTL